MSKIEIMDDNGMNKELKDFLKSYDKHSKTTKKTKTVKKPTKKK